MEAHSRLRKEQQGDFSSDFSILNFYGVLRPDVSCHLRVLTVWRVATTRLMLVYQEGLYCEQHLTSQAIC